MRSVTSDFTDAIANGEDQIALIDFGNWSSDISSAWWFDEHDISSEGGIRLGDNFCTEENIQLGTACNSVEVSVFNKYTLPTFTEFQVFIGAATSSYTASTTKDVYAEVDGHTFECSPTAPYLLADGISATKQPSEACKALEIVRTSTVNNYICLCIHEDNTAEAFTLNTSTSVPHMANYTYSTPTFFEEKWASWDGLAIVRGKSNALNYYSKFRNRDGEVECNEYELCSLGYFLPSTTHTTNEEVINLQGFDRMTLFDADATDFLANVDKTHTLSQMFSDLCTYVGVTGDSTNAINGSFVPSVSMDTSLSLRQVLAYFAEAMGCIAKFDSAGVLKLYWITSNPIDIDYNFQRTVYNYSVAVIDKVQFGEISYGSGTNIYYEDTNFCGLTATEIQNIYTRLNAFASYTPCNASIFGHPGIESGDIVTVKNDVADVGVVVPVFVNNYAWNGNGSATIESTGTEVRPIDSDLERQLANTVTGDDLATSGKVEISGDNITAGIIRSHDGSSYFDLDNDEFVIENTKTYLQSDYSASDTTRIQNIILGNVTPTQADLDKYDWLGKGYLDVSDGLRVSKLINGTYGASVDVVNTIRLSAVDKEMMIKASSQVGSASEIVMLKAGGFGLFAEVLGANKINLPASGSSDTKLTVQSTSGEDALTLGVDSDKGLINLNGTINVEDSSNNVSLEQTTANSGGRIRAYQSGTLGGGFGANATRNGFVVLYNSSGTETVHAYGSTGEVQCIPQDVSSGFTPTGCSIDSAYKSAGICVLRIAITNSAAVSSGGSYSASVSFPSGCTPLMTTQSEGYYNTIPLFATLTSAGAITVHNVSGSTLTSGHTARFCFTFPCS